MRYQWVTSPFLVRHFSVPDKSNPHPRCGEAHPYSRWWCAFPVSRIAIPVRMLIPFLFIFTGNEDVPHREWEYDSPVLHIVTGNGDMPTGIAHPQQEWRCVSPGIATWLTGNTDVTHREYGCDSPVMHTLRGNTVSFYRVSLMKHFEDKVIAQFGLFKNEIGPGVLESCVQ